MQHINFDQFVKLLVKNAFHKREEALGDGNYFYVDSHFVVAVAIRDGIPWMRVVPDITAARRWLNSGAVGGQLVSEYSELSTRGKCACALAASLACH